LQWALGGVPFGVTASYVSCWVVVMRLFLDKARLDRQLEISSGGEGVPLSRAERGTLVVLVVMVALWLGEPLHGLEIAIVTMVGALASGSCGGRTGSGPSRGTLLSLSGRRSRSGGRS
jgi:hypothetical protein